MENLKICIAGSGAMASLFAYKLQKAGNNVTMLSTRASRAQEINEDGIRISSSGKTDHFKPQAAEACKYNESPDFVILLVKSIQLKPMLQTISKNLASHTKVICLLNGLGHRDTIKTFVAKKNIIMGCTLLTSSIDEDGVVHIIDKGPVFLGAKDQRLTDVLVDANFEVVIDEDVDNIIWTKAALNAATNPLCTLLECTVGQLNDDVLTDKIVTEFVEVARACKIGLDKEKIVNLIHTQGKNHMSHYTSMHQDLVVNGRKTEIDFLNGACVAIGKKFNIACPYNDAITRAIKLKETILCNNT